MSALPGRPAVSGVLTWRWGRLLPMVGPALFLAGWCLLALAYQGARPEVMPAPWSVVAALPRVWRAGLAGDVWASVRVAAGGWVLGCGGAVVVGVAIGRITLVRQILRPVIEVLRPVSALVWVPLAILWFGIGYSSKLFIVALATFFVAVVHVVQGATAVESRQLKVASMLALPRRGLYRFVIAPSAVPEIMLGCRQGLGVAWGGVIIAELISGGKGLGAMEVLAEQGYDFDSVVIGMFCFAVLGFVAVTLFGGLERLVFPWLAAQRSGAMSAPAGPSEPRRVGRWRLRATHALLGLILLIAGWWIGAALSHASQVVLPNPGQVASTLWRLLGQASFWKDIEASGVEFLIGYLLAIVTALIAAIIFAAAPRVRRALWVEVETLRFVIPFSWIPLAILWFQTSERGKVFVVWYAVFFSVILPAAAALESVDGLYLKTGRMLRLPAWRQLFQIRLRAAVPGLAVGAQVGVGVGWVSVIAAEYLGAVHGLGVFIVNAQQNLDTRSVMAAMVVIGVVGALLSALARVVAARLSTPGGR